MNRAEEIKASKDLKSYIEGRTGTKFSHNNMMLCPFHEDTDPSFSVRDDKSWKCFGACDTGGSVIDFVMRYDNVEFKAALDILDGGLVTTPNGKPPWHDGKKPKPQNKGTAKKPVETYKNMADFAQRKYGLPSIAFKEFGCFDKTINGQPFMTIPSPDGIYRLRRLGSEGPKYKPEKTGAQAQWCGLKGAYELAKDKTIVLCNGQTSVMTAQYYGVPAFCKTDGENTIPEWLQPSLIKYLDRGYKLYVALDCDDDGKGHKVAKKIIDQFPQYDLKFIDFGKSGGYDLADHCMQYKTGSFAKLHDLVSQVKIEVTEETVIGIKQQLAQIAIATKNNQRDQLKDLIDQITIEIAKVKQTISKPVTVKDPVQDAYQGYLSALENPQWITGLRTGITDMDYASGGLNEGIYTWLGETGMGKTTLLMSIAANLLKQAPGFIEVGEASGRQIVNRLVGHIAYVPWIALSKGKVMHINNETGAVTFTPLSSDQKERIQKAYTQIKLWRDRGILNLRDETRPNHTISLEEQIDKLIHSRGVQWAVIESTDNIPTPGANNEYQRISEAMFCFERITKAHSIPVLTSSQAGRNLKNKSNKVAGVHDPLGSNHVEGKSFLMTTIYNHWALVDNGDVIVGNDDHITYPKGTARLIVKKSRSSENGKPIQVKYTPGIGWYNLQKNN